MKTKIILVLILVALLAVIVFQNTQVVTYRMFFWTISVSQILLAPLLVLAGFLLGYLVAKVGKGEKKG